MAYSSGQDGQTFWYVGYGSLINRRTRSSTARIIPITLHGFQREWSYRNWGPGKLLNTPENSITSPDFAKSTALNVVGKADSTICAVLVEESLDCLASLDSRESGYQRLSVSCDQIELRDDDDAAVKFQDQPLYLYQALPDHHYRADEAYPILQSYIDVVLSGVIERFSETEAATLVKECAGFDCPILNDRAKPIYPRAQVLSADELDQIDQLLTLR